MIISHKHRYLFIEIPLTASWAIRHELCEYYGGVPILHKHASYPEFRQIASADKQDYFAFAAVRSPLDEVVSRYFKYKTNHGGAFSDPAALDALRSEFVDFQKRQFIAQRDATFADYFKRYHGRTYSSMIDLSWGNLDYVIRFEHLQHGFTEVLSILGISQIRPIPVVNRTQGRGRDWKSYYTPEIIPQAKKVFGPFMKRWGYSFPPEWGQHEVSQWDELRYRLICALRSMYYIHFRYSNSAYARIVRYLRASLTG